MRHLCDSNFWVALARESHGHHSYAVDWIQTLGEDDRLGFCRSTQQSFLRLLTNGSLVHLSKVSNREALHAYREVRRDSRVVWLDEPAGLEEKWFSFANLSTASPKVWMDAYLAAFAVLSGARLVTFDRGFRVYRGLDWVDPRGGG
jgi:toxin-antitoxin system PIN domain toxin